MNQREIRNVTKAAAEVMGLARVGMIAEYPAPIVATRRLDERCLRVGRREEAVGIDVRLQRKGEATSKTNQDIEAFRERPHAAHGPVRKLHRPCYRLIRP